MISRTFLLFFLGCFYIGSCQNENVISPILKSSIATEEKIKAVDSIVEFYNTQNTHIALDSLYTVYSTWLYKHKNYKSAITAIKASIKNQNNLPAIDTLLWQHRLYYLGLSYRKSKQYAKSIAAFQHPIIRYRNNSKTAKSYSELGRCYKEIGDYYKAIKYYQQGASLLSKQGNTKFLLINYVNTTQPFIQLKTPEGYRESLHYFLKADSLSNRISTNNSFNYAIKIGLGNSYNEFETLDIPKAFIYYNEAIDIASKMNDSSKIFTVYNELGNLYNTSDPDRGITYLKKANTYTKKDVLFSYYNEINFGYCYLIKGLYDQSITSYLKAVNSITKNNSNKLLDINLIYEYPDKNRLLLTINNLATAYLKKSKANNDTEALQKAIETFCLADQLIDLIRIESREFQSKLFWRKQSSELYGKAIEACYLAGDAAQAFFFMEKNKALLLTEDLKNQQLRQTEALPDSIIDQEIELKKEIYALKHEASKNKDAVAMALLTVERRLQNLQDSISQQYQSFKALKTESSILSLSELQSSLDLDTAVLMYNIGQYDDYSKITPENGYTPVILDCAYGVKTHRPAYGLVITKEEAHFFKLKAAGAFKQEVQELLAQMKTPFFTSKDVQSYKETAFALYEKLLPATELRTTIQNKRLRIIPDNYLHYLPFEALITSDNQEPFYWIQQNEISYAYSNSFLNNIKKSIEKETLSFAGFAPVTFEDPKLMSLQNSRIELQNTEDYFEATNYTLDQATKAQFLAVLPQKDIIHLATHADAQDTIAPWIAFRKEKLVQDELALTTNDAQLIVLSGCNTLLGKQETGEGVMSLARGFFHAGAQSVVSSLWSVDDLATSELMTAFYKNLSNGRSKAEALRRTKLAYLQNHSLSEASPYYWASFVLLGDISPLTSSSSGYWWWLAMLPIGVIVAWRFLKK